MRQPRSLPECLDQTCVHQPLPEDWRDWLRLNRERGCDRRDLFQQAAQQGFDPQAIALELGDLDLVPTVADGLWQAWTQPPLVNPAHQPRAWRVDTDLIQLYEIPSLLTREECRAVIHAIDRGLVPSTVTRGAGDYRTSRTCHLRGVDPELTSSLDRRFAALFGVDPALSEPLQGQRYDPGQYFKAHTDCFDPGTVEFEEHARLGGQRTWTLMVYLNSVVLGGETVFQRLGRAFTPIAGLALVWNNLHPSGAPNHATLHEALPVQRGRKYVITKWFRAERGRCEP
jgi:prolyl 4-hydroxylase